MLIWARFVQEKNKKSQSRMSHNIDFFTHSQSAAAKWHLCRQRPLQNVCIGAQNTDKTSRDIRPAKCRKMDRDIQCVRWAGTVIPAAMAETKVQPLPTAPCRSNK